MTHADPSATTMRAPIEILLQDLAAQAEKHDDAVLRYTIDALQRVHGLFTGYDGLADRGSPQQQLRVEIHNAIVAATDEHFEALVSGGHTDIPSEV